MLESFFECLSKKTDVNSPSCKKIIMTMSYNEAVEKFVQYKKNGLVGKAKHLIDNIDNLLTCINLEFGRDTSCFKQNVSPLFKLNLYEEDIETAATEEDISEIILVPRFMLENEDLLADEIANVGKAQRLLIMDQCRTTVKDSDNDVLPDIVSPIESRPLKVKGVRGFHKLKPYTKKTSTATSDACLSTSGTKSCPLSERDWKNREEQLLKAHQSKLSKTVQDTRDELLTCVICLSKEHTLIPCGHTFCAMCLAKLKTMGVRCFFCKSKVTSSVRMRLTD